MPTVIDHFEKYLGPVEEGWSEDADGVKMPFQIARFAKGSGPGTVAYATLGLHRYALQSPSTGRDLRLELLMLVRGGPNGAIPALLHQIAMNALEAGRAYVRGEVLGPQGPILPGSRLKAFYLANPVYLPDEFGDVQVGSEEFAIAWLVPISEREARYVARYGWERFEDKLAEADPDLTDFFRSTLSL